MLSLLFFLPRFLAGRNAPLTNPLLSSQNLHLNLMHLKPLRSMKTLESHGSVWASQEELKIVTRILGKCLVICCERDPHKAPFCRATALSNPLSASVGIRIIPNNLSPSEPPPPCNEDSLRETYYLKRNPFRL